MSRCARQAFTLIELLVVIAIIGILAAILFPVFAQAKLSAKTVVCMSNMRQLGMAVQLYLPDYDDTFFGAMMYSPEAGFAPQQPWMGYDNNNYRLSGGFYGRIYEPAKNLPRKGAIDPYLKDQGVKRCPVIPDKWQSGYATNYFNPETNSSYYYKNPRARRNEFGPAAKTLGYAKDGSYTLTGATMNDVERPAETLFGWEHLAQVPLCNWLQSYDWFESPPDYGSLKGHFQLFHREGSNTNWTDGHAKWMFFARLKRPYFSCRKYIYE